MDLVWRLVSIELADLSPGTLALKLDDIGNMITKKFYVKILKKSKNGSI